MSPEGKRVVLKQTCLIFIGNLCVEQQLRAFIASDTGGLLTQVYNMFETDVTKKPFDWIESSNRQLQVLVNCAMEGSAQEILSQTTIITTIEVMFKSLVLFPSNPEEKEALTRVSNLLSKLIKTKDGSMKITMSKEIVSRLLLYFIMDDPEYYKNALITLHTCCKVTNFRNICLKTHEFTMKTFDPYVKQANKKFMNAFEGERWDEYVNICASITAFCSVFPEKKTDFSDCIVPLIKVMGDKIDTVRKNSAVLLAKLVEEHEENKKIMKDNHGTEVLMSVQQSLMK